MLSSLFPSQLKKNKPLYYDLFLFHKTLNAKLPWQCRGNVKGSIIQKLKIKKQKKKKKRHFTVLA
jgi:hypothetical protein